MYSVDGVSLDNPWLGWKLRAPSNPIVTVSSQRPSLRAPGRPGVVKGLNADRDSSPLTFIVETPREHLDSLLALWRHGQVIAPTSKDDRAAEFEFLSMSSAGYGDGDSIVDVTTVIRLPEGVWRDPEDKTSDPATMTSTTVTVDAWPTSDYVYDAVIRVLGPVSGLQIRSGESVFTYPAAVPSGTYLRFESATKRAFTTTTDSWAGGTEVSGAADVDGPGGEFSLAPFAVSAIERVARLEVTTATRGAAARIQVRGRGAYFD